LSFSCSNLAIMIYVSTAIFTQSVYGVHEAGNTQHTKTYWSGTFKAVAPKGIAKLNVEPRDAHTRRPICT
jgi:hypothetical protein